MFASMDEGPPCLIQIIGGNTFAQNAKLARVFEDTHDKSLAKALGEQGEVVPSLFGSTYHI